MTVFDDASPVTPDGLTIRRRRRSRGWSRRDLIVAIETAHEASTGLVETIPRSLLQGVEEDNEVVPYGILCLIAGGLDCNPIEILEEGLRAGGRRAPRP